MKGFLVTSTPILDGIKIKKYLGVVNANIVIGANFVADVFASFTDFFGGNSESYQRRMNEMYNAAIKELRRKVLLVGGNAIIGFKVDFDELSGKGKSMFMLSATGTACDVEITNDNQPETDISQRNYVTCNELQTYIAKDKLIHKLIIGDSITENDWNFMYKYPSVDYLPLIIDKYYPFYKGYVPYKTQTYQLVSLLSEEDAVKVLYDLYVNNKKSEVCQLICEGKLFSPKKVLEIANSDYHLALPLLKSQKGMYTNDDVTIMKEILKIYKNLPEVGHITKGKTGMFGKEKDIVICPNGHKHDIDKEFCPECGLDRFGLNANERQALTEFEQRIHYLSEIFGPNK